MNQDIRGTFQKRFLSAFAATLLFSTGGSISALANIPVANDAYSVNQQLQTITIKGKVTDTKGEAIIGASILEKGTSNGAITDVNGNFSLKIKAKSLLTISCIGYKATTIATGSSPTLTIVLTEDTKTLDEVVVTALGIKKEKKALGYSVQDIKSDELLKNKSTNVINSLNGKIAGVNITQSGGSAGAGANIVLRGGTSLERDNQPLFVIDGVIYDNGTNIAGNSGFDGAMRTSTSYSNRVMDINPEDVENVSVLKGPTAAALYGSRAAAGAIVITTKKGQEGRTNVSLSSKVSVNWVNRLPEQQNKYKRGTYNQVGLFDDYTTQSWGDTFQPGETVYNNIANFFDNSVIFDNSASVSGGTKNGTFFLSGSNFNQGGIVPETGFKKNAFRFNGEQKYGDLTVGVSAAYTASNTDKTLTSGGLYGSGGTGAMLSVFGYSRSDDMKHYLNDDGSRYRMFEGRQEIADDEDNPYWIINKDKMTDRTNRFTGSFNLNYKVASWMDVMYKLGTDRYTTKAKTLIYPGSGVITDYQNGMMSESDQNYNYLSSNFMANFHKTISDFDLSLLLGQSTEETNTEVVRRLGYNFVVPGFFSFGNIPDTRKKFQQENSKKRLMGVYGEFRASYKNFAYLSFTGRNDWTSTLPVENRSYFYPSVSGSLVFTELLPKSDILSFGKIRASWAEVGKDTDPYATNTYLWDPRNYLGGVGLINSWTRGNPYLVPEKTKSTELGFEIRLFKGRLGFDYTYYTNNSFNQIMTPRLSQTTGYILLKTNGGDIINKGMELSITGVPVQTKDFKWETTLNLSGNRGKVQNLLPGVDILYVTDVQVGNAKAASFNNGDFMAISGSKWSRDDSGNVILDWGTGMPTSDNLATYKVGNREPKLLGGLNNNLQYKGWNLSFLLDFRIGGDIYNGTEYYMTNAGMSKKSLERNSITISGVSKNPATNQYENKVFTIDAEKYYKGTTEVAKSADSQSGKYLIQQYWQTYYPKESANYVTKTNWLRLRSVSLSYNVPEALLKKTKIIKGLTATVTGTNLFLWTNYKGMDPETSAAGSGVVGSSSVGIDYCNVPSTAGMSFGLNLTF
ncbi:SusC/RagA family TonB-linked outer membrane protein [uncultured Bacteroides sp.]|uniref:SusC/RagA family TonB-linked outer membrane protein n=1 Tax=uncultured Bacteroides sp. TaxID=162156 RepID=UPI002AA63C26|nr:SusC/RagA family TonB-linked outer membrane protein [uncultured Bacteroides sp.]